MFMRRAFFIYNPEAGGGRLLSTITDIREKLQQCGAVVELLETQKSGDARKWARQAAADDWVIVMGGDGSVHEVVNGLAAQKNPAPFSIIPGGTANDYARVLGIPLEWQTASQFPLLGEAHRATRNVDVIRRGENAYAANFWGIGYVTQVSDGIESNEKRWLGKLAYFIETMKQLGDIPTFNVHLEWADGHYEGPAQLVLVLNGNSVGGIRLLSDDVKVDDGWLDVLVLKRVSVTYLRAFLGAKWGGQPPVHEELLYFKTKQLKVDATPRQAVDCDGEDGGDTPTELTVLPGHLRLLLPLVH